MTLNDQRYMEECDAAEQAHCLSVAQSVSARTTACVLDIAQLVAKERASVRDRETAELRRYREREPLVKKLVFEALDERLCECDECLLRPDRLDVAKAACAVRDFRVKS